MLLQHIILEQPGPVELECEDAPTTPSGTSSGVSAAFPWLISGASQDALRAQASSLLAAWTAGQEEKAHDNKALSNQAPEDIAFSLATSRSPLKYRATVTYTPGDSSHAAGQIQTALASLAQGEPHPNVATAHTTTAGDKPRLAFLFSGQGSRMPTLQATQELGASFPIFSTAFQAASAQVDKHLEHPLLHALADPSYGLLERADFSQAALFVFEVAMFRLLESLNVRPDLATS